MSAIKKSAQLTAWKGSKTLTAVWQKKSRAPLCSTSSGSATRIARLQYRRYGTYSVTGYSLEEAVEAKTHAQVETTADAARAS